MSSLNEAGYRQAVREVSEIVAGAREEGLDPHFLLPPADVVLVAEVIAVEKAIARNPDAHEIVRRIERARGPRGGATLSMLVVALEHHHVKVERVSLARFVELVGGRVQAI